jgi:hypothetical protein
MDYFQGVVTEYLRADRSCFVNPEFWLRGNLENPHDKPHWFVDVLALNMRERKVYLCEVTYAKQPRALTKRLQSWKQHWELINQALKEDSYIERDWPVVPWVFAPATVLKVIRPDLLQLFPDAGATELEAVLPWLYCNYDRKPEHSCSTT